MVSIGEANASSQIPVPLKEGINMTTDSGVGAHAAGSEREIEVAHTEPAVTRTTHDPVPDVYVPDLRQDPVRWGPVWAGVIVALATFLLVELLFFAFGWLTMAESSPGTTAGWISGLIAPFAFFVGGLIAGATSIWHGAREGMVHGVLVWALGLVGILFLTLFGGGALFGSVANVVTQVASLQPSDLPDVQATQAVDTAREAAQWALLALVLSLGAAAAGGMVGVKMGSSKDKPRSSNG